jgi:hypothetical protein
MGLAERTLRTAQVDRALHCPCGRVLIGDDFDIDGNRVRLAAAVAN